MIDEQIVNVLAVIGALTVLFFLFKLIGSFKIIGFYITARFAEAPIPFLSLVFMRIRKVNINEVVHSFIVLSKVGITINVNDLEVANLAGHDLSKITTILVTAKKEGILMTLQQAIDEEGIGSNE